MAVILSKGNELTRCGSLRHMASRTLVSIGFSDVLLHDGTKQIHEPMLTCFQSYSYEKNYSEILTHK